MFAGFRSRWTTPRSWAWWTARASVRTSSAASRGGWGSPFKSVGERSAFDQFQGEERLAVVFADLEDLDDVRVLELGGRGGLGPEASQVGRGPA